MTFLPIVERELIVAARRPALYRTRSVAALIALAAWLLFLWFNRSVSPASVAKMYFTSASVVLMACCLLSGVFLTADCISAERREGTLGLLFLTDLRGLDVVLGKLSASSVNAIYGLIAIVPVLALPLLMGGVTGGEFFRSAVALFAAILFSLCAGLMLSVFCHDSRQAMAGTLALVVFFTIFPSGLVQIVQMLVKRHWLDWAQYVNPGYLLYLALDAQYHIKGNSRAYIEVLALVLAMSFLFLTVASLKLPGVLRESESISGNRFSKWWMRVRFGRGIGWRINKAGLRSRNPILWLNSRDRLPGMLAWMLLMTGGTLWIPFYCGELFARPPLVYNCVAICFYGACLISLAMKCLIAMEASRRISEDRESGALELLLATPLQIRHIFAGQRLGLLRHFKAPMVAAVVMNGLLLFDGLVLKKDDSQEKGLMTVFTVGNSVSLFVDFHAIGWVGMWKGISSKKHHRAILATLLQVLTPAWITLIFFIMAANRVSSSASVADAVTIFVIWYMSSFLYSLIVAARAAGKLDSEFKMRAAHGITPAQKHGRERTDEMESS